MEYTFCRQVILITVVHFKCYCKWLLCVCTRQTILSEVMNMPQMSDLHPKMKICWKLFHPLGHPRCRWVCLSDQNLRNIALHHSLTNRSSAVNGCRQNESPRDIGEKGSEGAVTERTVNYFPSPAHTAICLSGTNYEDLKRFLKS